MKEIQVPRRRRPAPASRTPMGGEDDFSSDRFSVEKQMRGIAGLDMPLVYITLALSILGLAAVYSASAIEATDKFGNSMAIAWKQLVFLAVGFVMMLGISRVPYFRWARWSKWIALGVIGLLTYTMQHGVESFGAERWINIGGIQFQPSEMGKISVALLLADTMSRPQWRSLNGLNSLINFALIFGTVVLIYQQPSLSMTLILLMVTATVTFISGVPLPLLASIGAVGGYGLYHKIMHTEYQRRRIEGWLNPWKDPQDTGYNLVQSLNAIGSGGLFGTGLGMSHQKLYYLPFQYTDFIFAVWAEEWGLAGCVILIGLFVALLYRGFMISQNCKNPFGQLLAAGLTLILTAQIGINMAVATGMFPVTGVTLPLISYGGTSVLVTMMMLGILLNISRYRATVSRLPQSIEV